MAVYKQSHKFTAKVPLVQVFVYGDPVNKPGFATGTELKQGIFPFGPAHGMLTAEKLTASTVEWLQGKPEYNGFFEKLPTEIENEEAEFKVALETEQELKNKK